MYSANTTIKYTLNYIKRRFVFQRISIKFIRIYVSASNIGVDIITENLFTLREADSSFL